MKYISALIADLKHDLAHFSPRKLKSIFLGGGTPSLISAQAYEKLFHELQGLLFFEKDIEITLEANPGTLEQQRFLDYRALGINRLSLGIQSFNAKHLQTLGRIHNEKQAHRAIEGARWAGFDNLNIDIMHSLPNQSIAQGINDLQTALAYQPEHVSWYQLTIEPNTVFFKKHPALPPEDESYALEKEGLALLAEQNYQRYEISAFCQKNKTARHNLNYWLFGDYYGIGAGAHGKVTSVKNKRIIRTRKHRQPIDYLSPNKPYLAAMKPVKPNDLIFEFMLNTTRLQQPIKLSLFTERTGLSINDLIPKLELAKTKGLINLDKSHWQVTSLGRRYTNELQALFLPD